jgi:hypothetical protein
MAENKTSWTGESVAAFLDAVPDPRRRADGKALCALFERTIGEPPEMFGPTIVGFGRYRYRYDSGREGEACATGFSPRARELVLYVNDESERTAGLLQRLGKYKAGKCCVYVKRLEDLDQAVLAELIAESYRAVKQRYPDP